MKIIFFGTADISNLFLKNLYENNHNLLIVTRLDKNSQRGQKLHPPKVKTFCLEKNIPFIQLDVWTQDVFETVKSFNADLGIAVSFGKIIPENIFDIPRLKTINIHFSLLPKYRGAAPVQYSILNGEQESGVCAFFIEKSLDSGDIIAQRKINIDFKDSADSLFAKMTPLGIEIMNEAIESLKDKNFKPKKQTGAVSFAPSLKKEDGHINWNESALNIYNRIRGLYSSPGSYCMTKNKTMPQKRLKIIETEIRI